MKLFVSHLMSMNTHINIARLVLVCLLQMYTAHAFGKDEDATRNRNSEIDLGLIFFTSVAADTVYANLYKTPLLGGANVGYTYRNAFMEHSITFRGGAGRLYSPYESDPDYPALDDLAFQLRGRYTGAFRVFSNSALGLYVGPGAHFSGSAWIPDNSRYDVLRYAWLFHSGGGVNLLLRWRLANNHHIKFHWYVPVLGAAWRPPYAGYTLVEESLLENEDLFAVLFANQSLVSFHNFISSDLRVSYEYQLSVWLALVLEYYGVIEYTSVPRDRVEIQSNVNVGVSFRL